MLGKRQCLIVCRTHRSGLWQLRRINAPAYMPLTVCTLSTYMEEVDRTDWPIFCPLKCAISIPPSSISTPPIVARPLLFALDPEEQSKTQQRYQTLGGFGDCHRLFPLPAADDSHATTGLSCPTSGALTPSTRDLQSGHCPRVACPGR